MSTTFSIRIDEDTKERLERLAKSTSRSRSYLILDAIKEYIYINEWQIREIEEAVEEADKPGAKFIDHEKVKAKWEAKLGRSLESKGR